MPTAKSVPGKTLLSPTDYPLILVDFQVQMAFATKSIDGVVLCYNAVHWRKRADAFRYNCIAMAAPARTAASRQMPPFADRMLWKHETNRGRPAIRAYHRKSKTSLTVLHAFGTSAAISK
jgi:hypothetical protein